MFIIIYYHYIYIIVLVYTYIIKLLRSFYFINARLNALTINGNIYFIALLRMYEEYMPR